MVGRPAVPLPLRRDDSASGVALSWCRRPAYGVHPSISPCFYAHLRRRRLGDALAHIVLCSSSYKRAPRTPPSPMDSGGRRSHLSTRSRTSIPRRYLAVLVTRALHPCPGLQHPLGTGLALTHLLPHARNEREGGLVWQPSRGREPGSMGWRPISHAHMPPPHVGDGAHSSAKYRTDNPTRRRFSPERGIDIDSSARAQWHPSRLRARWLAPSFPAKGHHWPPTRALRSSCAALRNETKDP